MELRHYQISIGDEAVKLLEWMHIAYLAMQVRTGKTLTALYAADKYGAKAVLFVTKKKAISSIEDDYLALAPSFKLTVTNYESVHKTAGPFDLVIIDEAHCLGQYPIKAERVRTLKEICNGLPIIYLSGTPTPESYSQIYHQFWISSHSPFKEWPSFYKWANAGFVRIKKRYYFNREINDYTGANKQKIDEYCKHLFLTYTQEEAGFEQDVKEEVIYLRMSPKTYGLAGKLLKDRVYIGRDGQEIVADTEVKLQNKLHQVYSGSVIAEDGEAIAFDHSKASFIKQHFKGKRIAIFYKFKAEYCMLLWAFGDNNLTSDPDVFANREGVVFASQIQSGREGINLSSADCIIMFNIDFSSVSYQQARARMQALERKKEAMLYWIFSENGIERKIYERVVQKQDYTISYFMKDFLIARREGNVTLVEKG